MPQFHARRACSRYGVNAHRGLAIGGTNIDAASSAVFTRGAAGTTNPTVGEVIADGRGDISHIGIFANVFYDVNTDSGFKPLLGAGLGQSWVKLGYWPSGVRLLALRLTLGTASYSA